MSNSIDQARDRFKKAADKAFEEICEKEEIQPWQEESVRDIVYSAFSKGVHYACDCFSNALHSKKNI